MVALVIVVRLAAYTFLTLHYRKTAPSYRRSRSGYQTVRASCACSPRLPTRRADRPTSRRPRPRVPAVLPPAPPPGLGSDLVSLLEMPLLPAEITQVSAAGSVSTLLPYRHPIHVHLGRHRTAAGRAELYVREDLITLVPTFEQR